MMRLNHDAMFKELISNFFIEFLALFFPDLLRQIDTKSLEYLDKEFFTGILEDYRREADIVVKTRFHGADAYFIVLIEGQGRAEADFGQRLFFYVALLHLREKVPVYPIVVFYNNRIKKPQPDIYQIKIGEEVVLELRYHVLQLGHLNWRDFIRNENPIAAALMARMNIRQNEMPYVKLECLKLLAKAKLNRKRMRLIAGFVDAYLQLNAEGEKIFQQEVSKTKGRQREAVMEYVTTWERRGIEKGMAKGLKEGEVRLILRMLKRLVGTLPLEVKRRIRKLSLDQLESLSDDLLDFASMDDLLVWLKKQEA
jgi:predicted transposase/invertase (TIGR01784 family)